MDNSLSFPTEIFLEGLRLLSIPYHPQQLKLCQKFFEEYLRHSEQINISNIRDPKEFVIKHLLDSLSALPFFKKSVQSIADLGSGGGFPGIILGIFAPHISITLIDVVQKKVDYLNEIIQLLSLPNIRAFNGTKIKIPGSFDLIVSRALGSLQKILLYAKPYLSSQTEILAYKGRLESVEEELKTLKSNFHPTIHRVSVPFLDAERHIVLLTRH